MQGWLLGPWRFAGTLVAVVAVFALLGDAGAIEREASLNFARDGVGVKTLSLSEMTAVCEPRTVEVADPYYGKTKRFRACPLRAVLELGFGVPVETLAEANLFFRALDGYVKPAPGARLGEAGGFVAFADAEREGWELIDRRQVDPGPFYVVWTGEQQADPHRYPWPYQLSTIEIAEFETEYPHTVPPAKRGSLSWRGFAIFRSECVACHAINGEGGKIGPDLNVPRSIVEYRPADQIKAFIREPQSFRYTSMPSHLHLTGADLNALVAYFEAMKTVKRDPGRP